MSNTDSFIDEVNEEVRRDQLYTYMRRYGWIAVLCVVTLVGGAAYFEYQQSQAIAAAQAVGDDMLGALTENDPDARSTALQALQADGPSAVVLTLMQAADLEQTGDIDGAAAALNMLADDGDVPQIYRDIAAFKAALLPTDDRAARRTSLDALAQPGAPFRLLAMEQLALDDLANDNTIGAITTLRAVLEDAGVSRGLRERAQTLIVALGEELDAAASE